MDETVRLPNGLVVTHVSSRETAFLFREIFYDKIYLRGGLSVPRDVVIDVGANIGMATLFFHAEAPGVAVFPFEPMPAPLLALRKNVSRYGINADVSACAVGASGGIQQLFYYPDNTVASGAYADRDTDSGEMRRYLSNLGFLSDEIEEAVAGRWRMEGRMCEMVTLSEVLGLREIDRVGLLKIDVEGAEWDVLEGIASQHWQRLEQIAVEVHDHENRVWRVAKLMMEHGMSVEVEQHPLLSGTELYMIYGVRM